MMCEGVGRTRSTAGFIADSGQFFPRSLSLSMLFCLSLSFVLMLIQSEDGINAQRDVVTVHVSSVTIAYTCVW
jgi:hypothetical protein